MGISSVYVSISVYQVGINFDLVQRSDLAIRRMNFDLFNKKIWLRIYLYICMLKPILEILVQGIGRREKSFY